MKSMVWLCAVSTALVATSGLLYAGQVHPFEKTAQVEVRGKLSQGEGASKFSLTVGYQSEASDTLGDALLVYAEPSHTLLFADVNTRGNRSKAIEEMDSELEPALAQVYSPGESFQHTLVLPYNPRKLRDTRIEVIMKSRGQSTVLASGKVNVSDFHYTTTFTAMAFPNGSMEYLAGNHCCSGPMCSRICANCSGAFFSCDLINCTITCEPF